MNVTFPLGIIDCCVLKKSDVSQLKCVDDCKNWCKSVVLIEDKQFYTCGSVNNL